jgi:hypothetical protein
VLIGEFGLDDPAGQFVGFAVISGVQVARALLEAVGFLWLAVGLRRLASANPSPAIRRLALIAGAITFGTALAAMLWQLVQLPDQLANDVNFGRSAALVALTQPISLAPTLAFSYVVWALIREIGGSGRQRAVRIGAITAGLATAVAVLNLVSIGGSIWLRSVVNATTDFEAALGWEAPFVAVSTVSAWLSALVTILFVTAFALGIHDPRPSEGTIKSATGPA